MTATAPAYTLDATARRRPVPAIWRRPSTYVGCVLVVFVFAPELRRIIDWRTSYSAISLISALPLIALMPAAYSFIIGLRSTKLDRRLWYLAWLWFGGFVYAYALGIMSGNLLAATYDFVLFCLPALAGLWVATSREPMRVLYERLAGLLLLLATVIGVYSFYQFAAPPAWELAWMRRAQIVSIGIPAPFQFRPFSTMNAPGPFADFLVASVLLSLPCIRGLNPARMLQFAAIIGALALTMVRSCWIACALGVLIYILLRPGRLRNLTVLAATVGILAAVVANAPLLLGDTRAGLNLQHRFETLSNVEADSSFKVREQYVDRLVSSAVTIPTGFGLGILGTAAKLGSGGQSVAFDNGYVARFTEMGYFGMACYLGSVGLALALAIRRFRLWTAVGDDSNSAIAAACISFQFALLFLDISADHHNALSGLFFWLSIAILYGPGTVVRESERLGGSEA